MTAGQVGTRARARMLPPVVYVPTMRADGIADDGDRIQLHRLPDGRVAMVVYTALDRLQDALGDDQTWALLTLAQVAAARKLVRYDVILTDVRPIANGGRP